MSEFLLIAPGDATEIDPDDLINITGIARMQLPDLEQGIGMYDLNEKLTQAGLLPEGMQVVKVTYMAPFDRLWFNYDKAE